MAFSSRDLADFARKAIEFRLLGPTAVVTWADSMIAAEDAPPSWAIELSLTPDDAHEMISRLRQVPGTPTDSLPMYLFLGLLRRKWMDGDITVGQMRGIGWQLHSADAIPTPDGKTDWGILLECEGEEFDEGRRSGPEIAASIDEKLQPYEEYERLLPAWAR
jgi:hypothetical protein